MHCKKRKQKRDKYQQPLEALHQQEDTFFEHQKTVKPLRALTKNQHDYMQSIENNLITFALGSAGTGKTYVAAAMAADRLLDGSIDRLVITRPGVEAGESYGFLPGELHEKYAPFVEPFIDVLNERLGQSHTAYLLKRGKIIAKPLAFMRGSTFKKAMVILDEAQNTTPAQMKLFLTRIGRDCKVIIDGDLSQKDINGLSGLHDAVNRLAQVPQIGCVEFGINDCVRSGIVMAILRAYQ